MVFILLGSVALAEEPKAPDSNSLGQAKFLILFLEDFSQEKLYKIYLPNLRNLYDMGYSGVITGSKLTFQEFIEDTLKLKGFVTAFPALAKQYGYRVYAYGFNIKKYSGLNYLPSIENLETKFSSQEKNGFILAFKSGQEKLADQVIEKLYESGELKNTVVAIISSGNKGVLTVFANKIKKSVKVDIFLDDGIVPTLAVALGIYPPGEWGPVHWSAIYTGDWEADNQNRAKEEKEILRYVLKLRQEINDKEEEIKNYYTEKEKLLTKLKENEQENNQLVVIIKKLKLTISALKLLVVALIITGLMALFLEFKILKKKYLIF